MELTKQIQSGNIIVRDDADATLKIKLIDVTTTNSLMAYGEIRVANDDLSLDGSFLAEDPIIISIGLGDNVPEVVFTGLISSAIQGQLIILEVRGNAYSMRSKIVKKSLNKTNAKKVLQEILSKAGVAYEIGNIPDIKRHSYIMQSGAVAEEIHRFNESFGLNLTPYFDRTGKLIVKTAEENIKATDIIFEADEFKKFENGILETIVDTEIDIYNQIEIMDVQYYVASNRFLLNDRITKSYIAVTQI